MNQKKTLSILILALVVLIAGAGVLYKSLGDGIDAQQLATQGETVTVGNAPEDGTAPVQSLAPDFTVYDLDGNPHRLSDFRGMPVVLNFWASWCGPCKMEMPDFDEKSKELAGKVQFLMVNMTDGAQETVASASAFVAQAGYSFPVLYDLEQQAAMAYGVYSIPTTYFIDAEGYGIAYASGAIGPEVLQAGIDMILE